MWHQLLLVTFCLVSSTIGQIAFLKYFVLIPAEIHFPSNETACVDVRGAQEPVKVTVTLQRGLQDNILLQETMTESKFYKCIQFQTPPPEGGEEVVVILLTLVGPTTEVTSYKEILLRAMNSARLIQTDKPMYKRQETVHFKILTFDRDFLPVDENLSFVEIQNPDKNCICQWLNLKPQKGIVDLCFSLDSEAKPGVYIISTPHARQDFHVAEYVTPPFKVTIQLPDVVTIVEKSFPMKICSKYSFGKGVQGEITAQICRKANCYFWMLKYCPVDICTQYKGQTDKNGCLEVEVPVEKYNIRSYDYKLNFDAKASLVEDGTGVEVNTTASCRISASIAKVSFDDTEMSDSYYKTGLRYKAKMILKSADGSPMKSKRLYLTEEYAKTIKEHVYETNKDGEVYFTLNTKAWNGHQVELMATYQKEKPKRTFGELNPYYTDAHRILQPFTTITKSFLKVQPIDHTLACDQEHLIEVDYILRNSDMLSNQDSPTDDSPTEDSPTEDGPKEDGPKEDGRKEDSLELRYVVMGRGNLWKNGKINVKMDKSAVMIGTAILPLDVTAEIAPMASIFVYVVLNNGRIAADTERFSIAKCFNNKVAMNFSKQEAFPGSAVTLRIKADPGSVCSIRAVDEGVLFLRPEAEISRDVVYSFVARRNQFGYPYRVREQDPMCWNQHGGYSYTAYKRSKRSFPSYKWPTPAIPDVASLLKQIGLKYITNIKVKVPSTCTEFPMVAALNNFGMPVYDSDRSFPSTVFVDDFDDHVTIAITELISKIRSKFPETWIWKSETVGPSGQIELPVQLPDSITQWRTSAFCIGDTGLGIAPTTSIQAIQPFFMHLTHPYSVVKGETFSLSTTVFSYLSSPVMVKLYIKKSEDLQMYDCPKCSIPQCLLPQQTIVYTWEAKALRIGDVEIQLKIEAIYTQELCEGQTPIIPDIGNSDSLKKTVLVKAEGVLVEKSHNSILCGRGKPSSETISITFPPAVVPDSAAATFSVVGDLMGSALQGIEQLLRLPTGCGEQIMGMLAPNIHIMDYLECVNQLPEEVKKQGTAYISHGYQRELKYRREDGSFSTFGERDKEGNTWLSALVMKSFHAASQRVFVEKKYIEDIVEWLRKNQLPNGCFENRGKIFRSSLKGGVDDEVSVTAFVTSALLQSGYTAKDEIVKCAIKCLCGHLSQVNSMSTKALLAYTFTLSGHFEKRNSLLSELHASAVNTGGDIYWPADSNPSKDPSWSEPNSNEVEIASYVLLAHTSLDNRTKTDINKASQIAQWMGKQQNSNGGFANTQDTSVALQALSLFSKITYTKHKGLEIMCSPDGEGTVHHFHVDEKNRFLLQKRQLQKLPGDYKVQVNGEGCVFLKTTMKYNIYPNKESPFFQIQLNLTVADNREKSKHNLHYEISVNYVGPRNKTNMVLIEAELPSGFDANLDSLETLKTNMLVKRTETKDRKVILYLEELGETIETIAFSAKQQAIVKDTKPSSIKVYDYYQTGEENYMMYNVPKL